MTVEELAMKVISACEAEKLDHMLTGAFAFNFYAIPRSTKDVDIVVDVTGAVKISALINRLEPEIEFRGQVQFDTLTWGKRHIGRPAQNSTLEVELFELFDDPFVQAQFKRKRRLVLPQIGMETWIPTPEDIVVQKLRWGRSKDLDDARDVLATEDPETLDMPYIQNWCAIHKTTDRLEAALASIPPL
jgi:hypothetical protein